MLSGLIGLVGRGTVTQSVTGMLISSYFFAISYRALPFNKPALSRIKMFSEFQIFVRLAFQFLCLNRTNVLVFIVPFRPQAILVVCVVLQAVDAGVNFDDQEALSIENYGDILVVLTLAFIPVTLFFVHHGIKESRMLVHEKVGDNETGQSSVKFENPTGPDAKEEL